MESNIVWKPNQNDPVEMAIASLIKKGLLQHCGFDEKGEAQFKLTEEGEKIGSLITGTSEHLNS